MQKLHNGTGQAIIEFSLIALAFITLSLGIFKIWKLSYTRQKTLLASRYLAWNNLREGKNPRQRELKNKFFDQMEGNLSIKKTEVCFGYQSIEESFLQIKDQLSLYFPGSFEIFDFKKDNFRITSYQVPFKNFKNITRTCQNILTDLGLQSWDSYSYSPFKIFESQNGKIVYLIEEFKNNCQINFIMESLL